MKPNPVFVEITIRADRGTKAGLKKYFDAAYRAVHQLAVNEEVYIGAIGRRGIVTKRSLARLMRKYGFYGNT